MAELPSRDRSTAKVSRDAHPYPLPACLCGMAIRGAGASLWLAGSGWSSWEKAGEALTVARAVSNAQRAQTAIASEIGGYV